MSKTETSVGLLQAVAVIAGLAVLLWSLGLPSLRFVDAASLTSISDTLSDSDISAPSNHTIEFTIPAGGTPLAGGDTVIITFPDGASDFDLTGVASDDVDFATTSATGDYTIGAGVDEVDVAFGAFTVTFTLGTNVTIATGTPVFVEIGTNATFGSIGDTQITNPTAGSYDINVETNDGSTLDAGETIVVILDNVDVTASVDTVFNFSVAGVGAGGGSETVNGDTITGSTTATAIAFGTLASGTASTTAQDLTVSTNASQGYSVTVQVDHTLLSSTGADIDPFEDADTPTVWSAPTPTLGDDSTYGYWGVTSEDGTTTRISEFDTGLYIGASTTPRIVMGHGGPSDGSSQGIGTTRVGYRAEITDLQEAGDDYEAVLTYVATPVF